MSKQASLLGGLREHLEKQALVGIQEYSQDSDLAKMLDISDARGVYLWPPDARSEIVGSPFEKRIRKRSPNFEEQGLILIKRPDGDMHGDLTPDQQKQMRLTKRHEIVHKLRNQKGHLQHFVRPKSPRRGVLAGLKEEWIANHYASKLPYDKLPSYMSTPLSKLRSHVRDTLGSTRYHYPKPFQTLLTGQTNPNIMGSIKSFFGMV